MTTEPKPATKRAYNKRTPLTPPAKAPQPYTPPDQSHHMPSQDFVNITIPVTETTAQHAEPSPVPVDAPAPWGTLSWSP